MGLSLEIAERLRKLSANLCTNLSEVIAVFITDRSYAPFFFYNSESTHISIQPGSLNAQDIKSIFEHSFHYDFDAILAQIRKMDSGGVFTSAVFEAENFRTLILFAENLVFAFILEIDSLIDQLNPYIFLTCEKYYRLLSRQANVDLKVPKLGNILGPKLFTPDSEQQNEWVFKFTLIGDSAVGKTSLVTRFVDGVFPTDFRATLGVNILTHDYLFMENQVQLTIFDIGSQKFFQRARTMYYQGTNAALLVFDLNNETSFRDLARWKSELDTYLPDGYKLLLIGNKSDLVRQVAFEEANGLASEWGADYIETSALLGENVEEAFVLMAFSLLEEFSKK